MFHTTVITLIARHVTGKSKPGTSKKFMLVCVVLFCIYAVATKQ